MSTSPLSPRTPCDLNLCSPVPAATAVSSHVRQSCGIWTTSVPWSHAFPPAHNLPASRPAWLPEPHGEECDDDVSFSTERSNTVCSLHSEDILVKPAYAALDYLRCFKKKKKAFL